MADVELTSEAVAAADGDAFLVMRGVDPAMVTLPATVGQLETVVNFTGEEDEEGILYRQQGSNEATLIPAGVSTALPLTTPFINAEGDALNWLEGIALIEAWLGEAPVDGKVLAIGSGGLVQVEPSDGGAGYTPGGTDVAVTDGGTGRSTSTTAYGLIAAGTTATGAHQTLAAGATTEVLVGGGASALPLWTTATGSGAPVRATSPTLVTPLLGTVTSGDIAACTVGTLTGVLRADTGVFSVDGDVTDIVAAASTSAAGKVELLTTAELQTGSDTTRAATAAALRGTYGLPYEVVEVEAFLPLSDVTTGDGAAYFRIPSKLNGWNLVVVGAHVITAGTTGTTDIQIARIRAGTPADMLSTKITIDSTEVDTITAATPAVVSGSNDDVATGDLIRIDVDATATTKAKGLLVTLEFALP